MFKEFGIIQKPLFCDFKISHSCGQLFWAQITIYLSCHLLCFWCFLSVEFSFSFFHGAYYTNLQNYWPYFLKVLWKMYLDLTLLSKGKNEVLLIVKKWVCCMSQRNTFFSFFLDDHLECPFFPLLAFPFTNNWHCHPFINQQSTIHISFLFESRL